MYLIEHGIPFKEWTEQRKNYMETLWNLLRPHKLPRQFTHINVGVIYHPPNADNNIMINHISHCLDYILQRHLRPGNMLCGDFNHLPARHLKAHYCLKQIVTVHTLGVVTLDNIYTNMEKYYRQLHTSCPFGSADNDVVICKPYVDPHFNTDSRQEVTTKVMGHNERVMCAADLHKSNGRPIASYRHGKNNCKC